MAILHYLAPCWLLSFLPLISAQFDTQYGILQIITPTTDPAQVPSTASDAASFWESYLDSDTTFMIDDQISSAISAAPASSQVALKGASTDFESLYLDAITALWDTPSQYLSQIQANASSYGSSLSSGVLSQMSNLLIGYESLATLDILSSQPSQSPVTPGPGIGGGSPPTVTAAASGSASAGTGMSGVAPLTSAPKSTIAPSNTAVAPSSSSSHAAAAAPTADLKLIVNAVAGAVGIVGLALL